jgi:tRNA-dihydrouridine synthase B
MLKIGSLSLDVPFFQAPLSGYSDYAMRKLAITHGCPLTFAGVMLDTSAAHPKILSKDEFRPFEDEHPVGAQILGKSPSIMVKAAKDLINAGYDLIDLNFACPAPKVLRRGRGGALIDKPDTVIEIYRQVRKALTCPVTIKLRAGFDNSQESFDNFHKIIAEVAKDGIDAITIHGRSVQQKYKDKANWQILADIKKEFPNTIIIGSGDLFEADDIAQKMRQSGVDGVMIARGAIGNPWIFNDLRAVLTSTSRPQMPTIDQQCSTIMHHFELVCRVFDNNKAVRYLRKFLVNYAKLHPERKKAQVDLIAACNKKQLLTAMKTWYGLNTI